MVVFGGGIVPPGDIAALTDAGVAAIFTPGSSMDEITAWLEQTLDARETAGELRVAIPVRAWISAQNPRRG